MLVQAVNLATKNSKKTINIVCFAKFGYHNDLQFTQIVGFFVVFLKGFYENFSHDNGAVGVVPVFIPIYDGVFFGRFRRTSHQNPKNCRA